MLFPFSRLKNTIPCILLIDKPVSKFKAGSSCSFYSKGDLLFCWDWCHFKENNDMMTHVNAHPLKKYSVLTSSSQYPVIVFADYILFGGRKKLHSICFFTVFGHWVCINATFYLFVLLKPCICLCFGNFSCCTILFDTTKIYGYYI